MVLRVGLVSRNYFAKQQPVNRVMVHIHTSTLPSRQNFVPMNSKKIKVLNWFNLSFISKELKFWYLNGNFDDSVTQRHLCWKVWMAGIQEKLILLFWVITLAKISFGYWQNNELWQIWNIFLVSLQMHFFIWRLVIRSYSLVNTK